MKLETIKKDKRKNIIIGSMIALSVVGCLTLTTTRAKYKSVQSVKLASGIVNYKVSDLKLVAINISEDGINYSNSKIVPTTGYTLNDEKSKCRVSDSILTGENAPVDESVTIEYSDGKLNFLGLTHNDTKCYVYFDKKLTTPSVDIIAKLSVKKGTPDFTQVATGAETAANNGIFETDDPMYGKNAKTYYWRGAATTNHVIFDNKCWRIVRINGDKSIRLIYNGAASGNTCLGNGVNTDSVVLQGTAYNGALSNNKFVGWTYASDDIQRPSNTNPQASGEPAPIKTALEKWYSTNITDKSKVVKGNFCNDRNTQNNETWRATGGSTQHYAAYQRLLSGTKSPTLSCPDGDVYSLDVGMITADEVQFAGASGEMQNKSYYLYNGQNYWTMSPYYWNGMFANVFVAYETGILNVEHVGASCGLRPVINLRSDITFNADSDGTATNPYIVQ